MHLIRFVLSVSYVQQQRSDDTRQATRTLLFYRYEGVTNGATNSHHYCSVHTVPLLIVSWYNARLHSGINQTRSREPIETGIDFGLAMKRITNAHFNSKVSHASALTTAIGSRSWNALSHMLHPMHTWLIPRNLTSFGSRTALRETETIGTTSNGVSPDEDLHNQ